jgi:NAD(P)-dependent dehydrogenase (short-subunit alcohol dehydrogenase family)
MLPSWLKKETVEVELEGKVAIVTGAARGVGRAIALSLAHEEASVVVSDLLEEKAKETAAEAEALGVGAWL